MFQLTTSRRGRRITISSADICKMFQLTTSRRGRHQPLLRLVYMVEFQLTTSRRGRRRTAVLLPWTFPFQLTTSRRGRRAGGVPRLHTLCFNSRPHEEVDVHASAAPASAHVSTHDLTKRSTMVFYVLHWSVAFQLTTSRRGRHRAIMPYFSVFMFQLTTSRRGRRLKL